jgi:hypothetical protein
MADNGLFDLMNKLKAFPDAVESIRMVEMENEDILRSEAVSKILEIYNFKPNPVRSVDSAPLTRVYNRHDNDCALIPNDPYHIKQN